MTLFLTGALLLLVSCVPMLGSWLFGQGVERLSAQPLLAPDLHQQVSQGLMPGQAWILEPFRLCCDTPELALATAAGALVTVGLWLLAVAAWRFANLKVALVTLGVALTTPATWALLTSPASDCIVFFGCCLYLFALSYDTSHIGGALLNLLALITAITTWAYGITLWVCWFIIHIDRHLVKNPSVQGTQLMRPVSIRTLIVACCAPLFALRLWSAHPTALSDQLFKTVVSAWRAPYPVYAVDGQAFLSKVHARPDLISALALTMTALPLIWAILGVAGAWRCRTEEKNRSIRAVAITFAWVIALSTLNGGPAGLGYVGITPLVPFCALLASVILEKLRTVALTRFAAHTQGQSARRRVAIGMEGLLWGGLIAWSLGAANLPTTQAQAIGSWHVAGEPMLNTQCIEMLNSALPAGANVHILDDSDHFSRLVGSLQTRGIIRRDIQLRPLYESTYAVSTATNLRQRSRADLLGAHVAAAHHERSIHLEVLRL